MITEQYISTRFAALLTKCQALRSTWHTNPNGVALFTSKSKYGEAYKNGNIAINRAFIGTTAFAKLDQTILHELAHLAAGIRHGHGKQWKQTAELFGMPAEVPQQQYQDVKRNISYKYTVVAHLVDGGIFSLGQVHRKTKAWAEYHNGPLNRKLEDGRKIARFEFVEN